MWIGSLLDFFLVVSVTIWLVDLLVKGALSQEAVIWVVLGLVALKAIGRAANMSLVRIAFNIGIPIAILIAYVEWQAGGDYSVIAQLLSILLSLFIVLFGLYIMIFGLFRRGRRRRRRRR